MKKVAQSTLLVLQSALKATISRAILLAVLILFVNLDWIDKTLVETIVPIVLG